MEKARHRAIVAAAGVFGCVLPLVVPAPAHAATADTYLTDGGTFTVPAGVTSISVTIYGPGGSGGGGGGGALITAGGGGGGGGAGGTVYSCAAADVTPGTVFTVRARTATGGAGGGGGILRGGDGSAGTGSGDIGLDRPGGPSFSYSQAPVGQPGEGATTPAPGFGGAGGSGSPVLVGTQACAGNPTLAHGHAGRYGETSTTGASGGGRGGLPGADAPTGSGRCPERTGNGGDGGTGGLGLLGPGAPGLNGGPGCVVVTYQF